MNRPMTFEELVAAGKISGETTCDECGDEFAETGPAAQSMACPGTCCYCYENGDDDEEEIDPVDAWEQREAERADAAYDAMKDEVP